MRLLLFARLATPAICALALDGPVLIDVVTDPESRPPFKPNIMRRTKVWKAPTPDTKAGTKAVFEMLKER